MANFASITFLVGGLVANSESFKFKLDGVETTWRFSSLADPPPYFIKATGSGPANFETALLKVLGTNPKYIITRDDDEVTITLTRYGNQYNFAPNMAGLSVNDISPISVINNVSPPAVTLNITITRTYTCDGIGTISLTVNNGTAPYTYEWNHGPTTRILTGLAPGTYVCTVRDDVGSVAILTIGVTPPPPIAGVITKSNPTTPAGTDGNIHVASSGGAGGPYTYLWTHIGTPTVSQHIFGLAAGTYELVIFDKDEVCPSDPIFVTLVDPSVLDVSAVPTHVSCHGGSNGALDLTVTGGTAPYTFAWADGPTTEDRTGLVAGSYTVTVTDDVAATIEATFVILQPDAPLEIEGVISQNTCFGADTAVIDVTVTGGTAPYTYAWDDGPTTQDRTDLEPGTYELTVTDANGCTAIEEFVITEPTQIVIEAVVAGNNIDVTVTGGTGAYSYLWNDDETTQDRSNISPGTYTLTVTDENGCTNNAVVVVSGFQFYYSQNPVPLTLAAADPLTKPNLSFVNEVWIQKNYPAGDFEKVATEEHPANTIGGTTFQGETYLDAFLQAYLPAVDLAEIVRADGMFLFFYYRHTEKFGTPPEPAPFTQINSNAVLLGGLSDIAYAEGNFYSTYLGAVKPFLTWEPATKVVLPEQPEFLYFLVNSFNISAINLKVKLYYDNGETDIVTKYTKSGVLNRYEVYCIPVGLAILDFTTLAAGRRILKYECWVTDQDGTTVSQTKTYEVDYEYYPHTRYLLYLNSLGGMNVLAITGKATKKVDMDQESSENHLGHDYDVRDLNKKITWSRGMPFIEFTTGYITDQAYFESLEDFIQSEEFYLLEAGRWLPVVAESKSAVFDEKRMDALNVLEGTIFLPKTRRYSPAI